LNDPSSKHRSIKGNPYNLDHMLYDFLIKPLEKSIKGKKRLLIVPDGVLSFIPFETLVDDNGKYLVENYNISYTQSMGVMDIINNRQYKSDRKPLLAFGGAVYDETTYKADMINSEEHWKDLLKNVYASIDKKRSIRGAYASLGVAKWDNLPGTLQEVKAISKLVKSPKIYTGVNVTENNIKKLSINGDLTKYKVLHFATHGLVMPNFPELSAIVLSQFKRERDGEDGELMGHPIFLLSSIKCTFLIN